MSEIKTSSGIDEIRGKTNGRDSGYFYMRNGKQFYRSREENYQQNQSPRELSRFQVRQLAAQAPDYSGSQSSTRSRL